MNKKRLALTFYFVLILTNGICQDFEFKPEYNVALEPEKGKNLLSQCSRGAPSNISSYWKVTERDILSLEDNLKKIKKIKSANCCFPGTAIRELNKYGFQYIGVTIKKRKYIYINAFYINSNDQLKTIYEKWDSEPLIMCDGGNHYWGVLFDLQKLNFEDLMINGLG